MRPGLTIVAPAAAATVPSSTAINSDRVTISPTARLRFDELRGRVSKISSTMLGATATAAAYEQALRMLAEIAEQAKASELAMRRGR